MNYSVINLSDDSHILSKDEEVENEADKLEAQYPSTSAENFDMFSKDKPLLGEKNHEQDAALHYNFAGPELDLEDPASKVQRKPPKRRTKEEIDQEKLLKEVKKLKREMNAAKNSKCEQYLFCYISNNVLALDEALKDELTARFTERSISEQLVFLDTNEMRAIWKRKRVDAFLEDGKLHSSRTMDLENVLATFIDGDSLAQLIKSNSLLDYLQRQLLAMDVENAQMTVVVYGKCPTRENVLNHALFEAFERFRVQFRFMSNALNCSFLIVQIHRALAKMEKKLDHDMSSIPVVAIEKGIREGPNLLLDWWSRMLEGMHRLSEEQKRALVERHPNPFVLMDSLLKMSAGDAMYELARIETTSGRRIGPVIAQKIFHMLTSRDGAEILYNC